MENRLSSDPVSSDPNSRYTAVAERCSCLLSGIFFSKVSTHEHTCGEFADVPILKKIEMLNNYFTSGTNIPSLNYFKNLYRTGTRWIFFYKIKYFFFFSFWNRRYLIVYQYDRTQKKRKSE